MAVKTDFPYFSDLAIPGAYLMIGEVRLRIFDETAEIDIYVFLSEAARRQDESIPPHERRPVRVLTVHAPFETYTRYLEAGAKQLVAACYELLNTEPEPHGLNGLFAPGERQ